VYVRTTLFWDIMQYVVERA